MSTRRKKPAGSPLLDLLVESLAHDEVDDRSDDAAALRAYGELALVQVPLRGVFPPGDDPLDDMIDEIAAKHLGLDAASQAFSQAMDRLEPAQRNDIEVSVTHLRIVGDKAYFYAGVAFGITLVDFGGASSVR